MAILRVPHVDPSVRGAGDDKLTVRGEGGLQRQLFGVQVAAEGLQGVPLNMSLN